MPFGDPFMVPADGNDPLFDQKHGGWLINNPGGGTPPTGGGAGASTSGFFGSQNVSGSYLPPRRRLASGVTPRGVTPSVSIGRWTPRGTQPGGGASTPAPTTGGGGLGFTPGAPAGWDIPDWNRILSLVAAGDPSLFGTGLDPRGNPYELSALRDYFGQERLNRERQAVVGADMSAPSDPWLRAYAVTQARGGASSDSSRADAAARYSAAQEAGQRQHSALQQLFSANLQHGLATQGGLINQYAQNQNKPSFWDYLGQLGGSALGGWANGGFKNPFSGGSAGGTGGMNPNWWVG